jgi:hypothetical protein
VRADTLRWADDTALRALRAATLTLRRPRAAFFFEIRGSMRRAPRTARRAAPVAVKAAPAAMSVALDATPLAASPIAPPALLIMPFFAMGLSRRNPETCRANKSAGSKFVPELGILVDWPAGLTLRDQSNRALSGG